MLLGRCTSHSCQGGHEGIVYISCLQIQGWEVFNMKESLLFYIASSRVAI